MQEEIAKGETIASCFRLDPEMKEELDIRNEEYTKSMKAEDEVIDILAKLNMEKQARTAEVTTTRDLVVNNSIAIAQKPTSKNVRQNNVGTPWLSLMPTSKFAKSGAISNKSTK